VKPLQIGSMKILICLMLASLPLQAQGKEHPLSY